MSNQTDDDADDFPLERDIAREIERRERRPDPGILHDLTSSFRSVAAFRYLLPSQPPTLKNAFRY